MTSPRPPVTPTQARFIRLGSGGRWAKACIDSDTVRFGVPAEPHDLCLKGDWDGARDQLVASGVAALLEQISIVECERSLRVRYLRKMLTDR